MGNKEQTPYLHIQIGADGNPEIELGGQQYRGDGPLCRAYGRRDRHVRRWRSCRVSCRHDDGCGRAAGSDGGLTNNETLHF